MAITIEDFLKSATEEQKALIDEIKEFAEEECTATNLYNQALAPFRERIEYEKRFWGEDSQITGLIIDQEILEPARTILRPYKNRLGGIRKRIGFCMERAIKIGMGDLGIIQRHYQSYVGKPLPAN
ncbi:MAG: hypothetical protein WC584_04610 [Candidatus Pacearchaeota archaeon]